jgi:hypothetical protein
MTLEVAHKTVSPDVMAFSIADLIRRNRVEYLTHQSVRHDQKAPGKWGHQEARGGPVSLGADVRLLQDCENYLKKTGGCIPDRGKAPFSLQLPEMIAVIPRKGPWNSVVKTIQFGGIPQARGLYISFIIIYI